MIDQPFNNQPRRNVSLLKISDDCKTTYTLMSYPCRNVHAVEENPSNKLIVF